MKIVYKSLDEIRLMRESALVVAAILDEVCQAVVPGISTWELDRIARAAIKREGVTSAFLGYAQPPYPAVTCISVNEEIVHGIPSARRLEEGDILSVDAGAVYEGWHADGAITFPVGAVPEETSRLLAVTEKAMWAGIEAATIGTRIGDLGAVIGAVAEEAGYGIVRDYTGHGIGRAMHEEPQIPNFGRPGTGMRLRRGMAVCLEPMFNLGGDDTRVLEDGWTVVTADGSLSAHFEHTVAITPDGPQVLTLA